ncbi:MAG: DUF2461 domain-containing protein [Pseudomonadota bacterium]
MFDTPFLGFGPKAITFFKGLEKDNTKAYFTAERGVFEDHVKAPLTRLLDEAAAEFGGTIKVFRQNRDVRFSKDKSSYKTSTYGLILTPAGRHYYAAISSTGFYAGTGVYEMTKDQLSAQRSAIDGPAGAELEAALAETQAAGLTRWTDADLKSAPRGVAKDHPRIVLMRMKNMVIGAGIDPKAALDERRPLDHALRTWHAAAPVLDWLEEYVGLQTAG